MVETQPDPGTAAEQVRTAEVGLDRDVFLRSLLRGLSGTLEEVVGLDEAAGFVSVVGGRLGREIEREYHQALGDGHLTREQVAAVLVDLKRRIGGDFFLVSQDDERIVLGNRACPFGDKVLGRPSLCMMTSNVFGTVTAENLGYARVELQEAIADGAAGCRVVVHLRPADAADDPAAREYFASTESAVGATDPADR